MRSKRAGVVVGRVEAYAAGRRLNGRCAGQVGAGVSAAAAQLCTELGPHTLQLVEAFGIPEEMLSAPIARDWVTYNAIDNQGEV